MWKILVAFVIFAALAVFMLMQTDAEIDMGGEKHGAEATATHDEAPAATAPASAAASQ